MDLKQLRTLVAIADTGSVTRASVALSIVQPAVSRHIKLLEEDLGVALFERNRSGMELTEEGRVLLVYARRVLKEVEQARAEIKPRRGEITGVVTIGLLPSTSDLVASMLVGEIRKAYPGIHLRILVGYAGDLQAWLESGESDASLLYEVGNVPGVKVRPLLEECLWVVDRPGHIVSQNVPVDFNVLSEVPLVLPDGRHGLRSLIAHHAALAGVRLQVVVEVNAMSVQKSLVMAGHGLTILPSIAVAEEVSRGTLVSAPLIAPRVMRKIVLAMPAGRTPGAAVRVVVSELRRYMKMLSQNGLWESATWLDDDDG